VEARCDDLINTNMRSFDMSFVPAIPLVFFVLVILWVGSREVKKALREIKTIARLKQSGILQPGTIMKIDPKRYPPVEYAQVVFQYKENKTTYRGKHLMSSATAQTLMKEDRAVRIRSLPGQPQSARIDDALGDSFETKRALIMGCALLACFVLVLGATGIGVLLGWNVGAVEVFTALVFFLVGLLSMGVAALALRFVLG